MYRTKRLLMSVTASALLTGSGTTNPSLSEVRARTANSETIEPDQLTAQSEAIILKLLKTIEPENALSLDQILAREPSLKRNTALKALGNLVGAGKIGRTGNGQDKPYLYYNPQAAEDRKIAAALPIISSLLFRVGEQDALSLNQLIEKRPDLNRGTAKKALEQLLAQGEIRRTTDDRYYDKSRGGGHGG